MNRFQLEKLYEVNGLKDYKLKSPVDLIKTHGIDYIEVEGFNRLNDDNKLLFGQFIVNFMNGLGLESRSTLYPKGIYLVEDIEYLVKEDPDDESYTAIGGLATAIDRNGMRTVHREWHDEDYSHLAEQFPEAITESTPSRYLRFEYEHQGRNEWLHVMSPTQWY